MLSEIKPKLTPAINIIARPFSKINPNVLTLLGLVFPILFLFLMIQKNYVWAFIVLLGSSFDMLDGAVARMTNKVTKFGGLLDSTLDRLSDALFILGFYYAAQISVELTFIVIIESYLISYIRSRAEQAAKGEMTLNVGIIERPERILALVLATVCTFDPLSKVVINGLNLTSWIFVLLAILSGITIAQRIYTSYKRL